MRVRRGIVLALAMAGALAGAQAPCWTPAWAQDADAVVAQRDDVRITAADLRQMIQMADPAQRQAWQRNPALLAEQVRQRLIQLSLLREAHATGWDSKPLVVYRADRAREAAIAESYLTSEAPIPDDFPSEAELHRAYDLNKASFIVPEQVHLAQIVLAVPRDAPAAKEAEVRQQAEALRQQLASGGDFAVAAKQRSADATSSKDGGELGWRPVTALPPPVRDAVGPLQDGAVAAPLRLPDGWHLLKLLGRRPAAQASFEEAHDGLVRALRQQRAMEAQRRYIAQMVQAVPPTVDQDAIAKAAATVPPAQP